MLKRILIAAAALLIALPVVLLVVLVYTETGLRLIAAQLPRLERFGVYIEGVSGTLNGPLHVERFELDRPRVHIVAHEIVFDPQMRGMLLQTISVTALSGRDIRVQISEPEEDVPPPDRPLRFLPEFMRVNVHAAEFTRVSYVHMDGRTVEAERLSGEARLGPRRIRVTGFDVAAEQFDASGDLQLIAQRPLGIKLTADGHLRVPSGTQLALGAELNGTVDELDMKVAVAQPSVASATATLTRPDGQWQIAGRISSPAFSFAPWLEQSPFSLRNVELEVTASPAEIAVAGNLGIPELDRRDLALDARGRYTGGALHVTAADILLEGTSTRLQANGVAAFQEGSPAIDATARWNNLRWPLAGDALLTSPRGNLVVRGSLPYEFDVTAHVLSKQLPEMDGRARGVIARERLALDDFEVALVGNSVSGGSVSGNGTLEFAGRERWTAAVDIRDVDPGQWHGEFPGSVSLTVEGRGQGLDRDASFAATVRDLRGTLRGERLAGAGTIERNAGGWHARNAKIHFADADLAVDGSWGDTLDVRWSLEAGSLAALVPQAAGKLSFAGRAAGPLQSAHVVADLDGEQLRYEQWRADRLAVNLDVDLAGREVSHLRAQAQNAGYGGPLLESLRIDGQGTPLQHVLDVHLVDTRASTDEPERQAELHVAGRYEDATWTATLTGNVDSDEEHWLEMTEPADLQVGRDRASLAHFCFAIGSGRFCADGRWERGGSWEGILSGAGLKLASLLPSGAGEADYEGNIEGRVHVFGGTGRAWQGEAGLKINDAAIIYRPPGMEPERLQLGSGEIEASADRDRIEAALSLQAFTETFVFARGQLLRNGSNDLLQMPLSGEFRARAADANILPILVPEIDHAAGLLTANARIGGTLAAPELDGRIELTEGELDAYRVNLALRDLNLTADLASNRIEFTAAGRAGDGKLRADGQLAWRDGASSGEIALEGTDILVADLPEYRVVASPDLRFRIDDARIGVTGTVAIPSARIQPVDLSGAVRISEDARYVGEHPAEKAGRFTVHSNVRVNLGEDVRLDTFGLQGRLTGGVNTAMRSGEVATGRGELSVVEGRYEAYGQTLDITRGRLLFEATPLDDPGLDIETRRKIETVQVGMNVRGTLRSPRLQFFSEPSMTQTQIVSYLLVGKPIEDMQSRDAAAVGSATDALALQGGGLIASQLGRRLGLQEVGVESSIDTTGETNTALVLGKFLSPRLFVSYGISLTESINTLKVRYTVSDRWVLKTEAGENQSIDAEYTIER